MTINIENRPILKIEDGHFLEKRVFGSINSSKISEYQINKAKLFTEMIRGISQIKGEALDEEYLQEINDAIKNPGSLQEDLAILEEKIRENEKEITRRKNFLSRGINFNTQEISDEELKERLSKLIQIYRHKSSIKTLIKTHPKILDICLSQISNIEEQKEIQSPFRARLLKVLNIVLKREGYEIIDLTLNTTITNDGFLTIPDFCGIDAFIKYELEKDGKKIEGIIKLDGTANPRKGNEVNQAGGRDFSVIVPYREGFSDSDFENLADQLVKFLLDKKLFV